MNLRPHLSLRRYVAPAFLATVTANFVFAQVAAPSGTPAASTEPSAPAITQPSITEATTRPLLELKRRQFPGTSVSLLLPATWTRAYWGNALVDPSIKAHALLVELPAPFAAARRGIGPGGQMINGFTVDLRENITVEDRDAVLVRGTRSTPDGIETRYFIGFGNAARSVFVAISFPSEQDKVFDSVIRPIVASIKWSPDAVVALAECIPFDFTPPSGLKQSGVFGGRLIFNESGKRNVDVGEAFMFVFSTRRDGKGPMDKTEFETNLLNTVGKDKKLNVTSIGRARFGGGGGPGAGGGAGGGGSGGGDNARVSEGWDGYGIVAVPKPPDADDTNPTSKAPTSLAIYLAQFVDEKGDAVYTIFGQSPGNRSNDTIPLFRSTLRNLKLRSADVLDAEATPK